MAISQEMMNQAELAKAKIVNSGYLDDDSKKNLLNIVAITTQATNGISPEEKIQKITDKFIGEVDSVADKKDKELMEI